MEFVRFGGVNSHKHKKQSRNIEFYHVPPENRGIFAFPLIGSIETYLVAWKYNNKTAMLLDRRTFEYSGLVWHHFSFTTGSMAANSGWVLDTIPLYRKKLYNRLQRDRLERQIHGIRFSNDDLEVFLPGKI